MMTAENIGVIAKILCVSMIVISGAFAKLLLEYMPPVQVVWFMYIGYVVCMAPVTFLRHWNEVLKPFRIDHQIIRGVLAVAINLLFIAGLATMDLSEAVSLFYVYPFLMCLGAILFLNERGSVALWVVLLSGFLGVVLIVQPASNGIGIGHLFILLAAVAVSVRAILHRHYSGRASPLVAALWERSIGALIASLSVLPFWVPVTDGDLFLPITGMVLASVSAQVLFVFAVSRAALVVLAPYTFWEVIFAVILNIVVFGIAPNIIAIVGTIILISSGVIMSFLRARN